MIHLNLQTADLYQSLGCKQLSDLVQEEYQTTQEVFGHKRAQEVRTLILERLPLFLHEHTYVVPRVSCTWLNDESNFIVRTFSKVIVIRSIDFAGIKSSKSIEASAISRWKGRGEIQLWLASDMQVDMYEVATSLCHLLFDTHKVIDALLFMTMLSMDHHTLQRRGYNGDYELISFFNPTYWILVVCQTLEQQKAKREAAIEAILKEKADKIGQSFVRSFFK